MQPHVLGRLTALPDQAEPLQRAQLLAALSVGAEIIRLRRMAPRLGAAAELDAAFEAVALGNSAIAIARLRRLDRRLASVPAPMLGATHPRFGRVVASWSSRGACEAYSYFDARAPA